MFFPLLRSKRFEVLALVAVTPDLVASRNVLPIVEPTKSEWTNLKKALDAGLEMGIIVNPQVGDYSPPQPRARRVQHPFPPTSAQVFTHANAIPTLIIHGQSTVADVAQFGRGFVGKKMILVNEAPVFPTAVQSPLATALALRPAYWVVRRRSSAPSMRVASNVDLTNNLIRQANNGLYPFDEFYSDRNITIRTDPIYGHFGDYSIVGEDYSDGGGRANNVALHHVYTIGPNPSLLRIRHYVSATHPDVATMWFDALSKLVADLSNLSVLSPLNDTSVLAEYRAKHASRAFPGLGKMKELALRHHLLLMTAVQ